MSTPTRQELTALDWIGASVALLMTLGLLYFPFVGRTFASMFSDFGTASLPLPTRLATSWWFPMALACVAGGGVARGLRRSGTLADRRVWIVGSFLFAGLGMAFALSPVAQLFSAYRPVA